MLCLVLDITQQNKTTQRSAVSVLVLVLVLVVVET